jgi:hypothetical protein
MSVSAYLKWECDVCGRIQYVPAKILKPNGWYERKEDDIWCVFCSTDCSINYDFSDSSINTNSVVSNHVYTKS